MALPGPDRPGRPRRPRKPRDPRVTVGNRYSTKPPPKRNTKIVWKGAAKPKPKAFPSAKYVTKKRGGGKGYVVVKRPPKGAPKAGAPGKTGAPAPVAGPYDQYKKTAPWGIPLLEGIDKEEASHLGYVSQHVAPWLTQGLANLTGVNPAAPGYNPTVQQQYLANVQGTVGQAFNAAAAATPSTFAPTTPGASTAAPNAYQGAAMREASAQRGGAALNTAAATQQLNTLQSNIFAQQAVMQLSDYAKGLPTLYAKRRSEARSKIDQWVMEQQQAAAEMAEEMRHNKVTEAISGMNAQTNAAIQFGRLGLDADEMGMDVAQSRAEANAPVPYGYVRTPDGRYVRDPSVAQATAGSTSGGATDDGTSTRDAQGRLRVPSLQEKGYRRAGGTKKPKVPAGWKVTRGADGRWWVLKPGAGTAAKPKSATDLEKSLIDLYKPGDIGGWEEQFEGNPKGAGTRIALWVRENKPAFVKSGRKVDLAKLKQVLSRVGGRPAAEALSILVRGYMTADGRWK